MPGYKLSAISVWNRISFVVVALAMLVAIATDQRPDDTSIRVALAAGALGLLAVIDLSLCRTQTQPTTAGSQWLLTGLVFVFLSICTLSSSWAGDPLRTLEIMAEAWGLFIAWLAIRVWAYQQPISEVRRLLRLICISMLALTALLFSEVASDQYIHDYLVNSLGMTMSIPNYYIVTKTNIMVSPQFLAQHTGTLCYLYWPMLLAIYVSFRGWKAIGMTALTLLTIYSVFNSVNETAILALAMGFLAFATAFMLPRTALVITAAFFSLAVLAMVPLTYVAHDFLELHVSPNMPASGQARIQVWYRVANSVWERPFFGHGVVHLQSLLDSGRGFIFEHAHSHNVFLQIWYEVGVVGSAVILLIGLVFLKQLSYLPNRVICFGVAGFVTVIINLTTTAWELWVPWHLGLLTLVAMIVTLLDRAVSDNQPVEIK